MESQVCIYFYFIVNSTQLIIDWITNHDTGQSGGNVHVLISSVIGQGTDPSLHIRSNGGNGGFGQPGGEGGLISYY